MPDPTVSPGQAWEKLFETEAAAYRFEEGLPFLRKFIRSPFIQLPYRYARLQTNSRILEAGCASGKFSTCFAMVGCKVVALDISPAMLKNAAELKKSIESDIGSLDIQFLQGDLETLDLGTSQFDLVINEGVVEHWIDHTERRRVFGNLARVVKPGGALAIIVPNGAHPFAKDWISRNPAFLSAPPMVRYSPELLSDDLNYIALSELFIDGIYAWRTIDQWGSNRARQMISGALQRFIPLPRNLRLRWGIHLIGMGRKR